MSNIRSILEEVQNKSVFIDDKAQIDQALKEIEEAIDKAIIPAISANQKGQFEDDGGNICWYLDDLEKALRNNLKEF